MTRWRLPLYAEPLRQGIEDEEPRGLNPMCSRCGLNGPHLKSPCLTAEGHPKGTGGVLAVGNAPTVDEDRVGRPWSTPLARRMREQMAEISAGPFAFDNAVRCAPGKNELEPDHTDSCRTYLAGTIQSLKPDRILCFGRQAVRSVLGRSVSPLSARRGIAWTSDGIPVFILPDFVHAARNKFVGRWLDADLEWALTVNPTPPDIAAMEYTLVTTPEQAIAAADDLRAGGRIIYDTETYGLMFDDVFRIVCTAAARIDSDHVYVWTEEAMDDPATVRPLVELMADPMVLKDGQNLKYDLNAFRADDRDYVRTVVRGSHGDSMLWKHMMETESDADLETLSELVGLGGSKDEMAEQVKRACERITAARKAAANGMQIVPEITPRALIGAVKRPEADPRTFAYGLCDKPITYRYCARDVAVTRHVLRLLEPRMRTNDATERLWETVNRPVIPALSQIEAWGMAVSRTRIELFGDHLRLLLDNLAPQLQQWGRVDCDSSQDVVRHLYHHLKLPVLRTTKHGQPSTDAKSLEALKNHHPFAALLLDYREMEKLRGTYADGMLEHVRADGRIHPSIRIDGTRTARFSMQDPNLQNIPSSDSELGAMAKGIFIAPPGRILVQLDYSQLEYRVAAMLSQDPVFMKVFCDGYDLHTRTAQLIGPMMWGISQADMEAMTDDQLKPYRRSAKTVNFGLFYGMGDATLAELLRCSVEEAGRVRQAILGLFQVCAKWIQDQIAYTQETGVTWTWIDGKPAHVRQLYDIDDPDGKIKSRARNGSFNTPVQGSAAHYMTRSLIELVDWIVGDRLDCKIINTVHDSVMFECAESIADEISEGAKDIMESWPCPGVPLKADTEWGWSWGTLYKKQVFTDVRALLRAGMPAEIIVQKFNADKIDIDLAFVERVGRTWK